MFRRLSLLLSILIGSGSPALLAAAQLISGPIVGEISGTNAVIRWTTDVPTGSRVQFGTQPGQLNRRGEGELSAQHRVTLANLQPGTRYYFTAGTARLSLATNSFTTAGPDTSVPTTTAAGKIPGHARAEAPRAAPPTRESWGHMASLHDHFNRHGRDFNAKSPDDYARLAWEFLQRAKAEALPMKLDEDGILRVFDPKTGAFAAYNRNDTTKTYFKPGSADYFERQPGRPIKPRDLKAR